MPLELGKDAPQSHSVMVWDTLEQPSVVFKQSNIFQPRFATSKAEIHQTFISMVTTFVTDCASPFFKSSSQRNGGIVKIDRRYGYLPLLWGKDGKPVFVYEIIEEIEGIIDLSELQSRLPSLSYAQIAGSLGFVRSLSQFNRKCVDIDSLVDEAAESDPEFLSALEKAVEDQEAVRVLAPL